MLTLGPKVRLLGVMPQTILLLQIMDSLSDRHKLDLEVSHIIDGIHTRASIHYIGGAPDVIFKSPATTDRKLAYVAALKASVGPDFDIILEDLNLPNEHIHGEYQPKESY